MNKRFQTGLFLFILILATVNTGIPSTRANPIAITQALTGGIFATNQTLQLSEAHVEILIQPQRINESTFSQTVSIYGNYSIFSPTAVNTTIAFAYPTVWDYAFYGSTPEVSNRELDLSLNGTPIEYQTLDFDDLFIGHSLDLEEEYDWIQFEGSLTFASFNTTTQANTTLFLEVQGSIESTVLTDTFEFSYCVGTGRTWGGHAYETVQISVENYEQYLDTDFIPDDSLSVSILGDTITGNWNLDLTNFEHNYVGVQCMHRSWDTPPQVPFPIQVTIIATIGSIAVIGLLFVCYRRR